MVKAKKIEMKKMIENLRNYKNEASAHEALNTAVFFAENIYQMTSLDIDLYHLCKIYFKMGEYHRCIHLNNLQGIHASYLLGQCFYNLKNYDQALACTENLIESHLDKLVQTDALHQLVNNHMFTQREELSFLQSLQGQDQDLIKALYFSHTKHEKADILEHYNLLDSPTVLLNKAESLIISGSIQKSWEILESLFELDPHNPKLLLLYISCLVLKGMKNRLFVLSHELIDAYPEKALPWFAVGAYYFSIKKYVEARTYFSKATLIDPNFGNSWTGFAHSFALEEEHDQALSAYSTAARIMPESHLPALHIGMEHVKLHHWDLAQEFMLAALEKCSIDPLVYNELGVLNYKRERLKGLYSLAKECFKSMLHIPSVQNDSYCSLGLIAYHENNFNEALDYLHKVELTEHFGQISQDIINAIVEKEMLPLDIPADLNDDAIIESRLNEILENDYKEIDSEASSKAILDQNESDNEVEIRGMVLRSRISIGSSLFSPERTPPPPTRTRLFGSHYKSHDDSDEDMDLDNSD